jgi:hypothetical protein
MKSLLGEEEVCSHQTRKTTRKGFTFDPTVGLRSNFYSSFRRPFLLELVWNCYSLKRWSVRGRPE